MKQKLLCLAILCLPVFVFCQEGEKEKGIKWVSGLTWQQVKEKAKKENKYIFVDCYATWCKPCKQMDKEVYTVDSVGDYLNDRFVSVKLQMDVTKNDNEAVRNWRKTAKEIERQYRISAYPSYVFFAPGGEVVSKEVGYKKPQAFIQVARNATDPGKQYFVLLKKYKKGKLDHAGTLTLLQMANEIGDTADYRQILKSYYAYLRKQKKEKLYTKQNIEFIAATLDRSDMVLFNMFYPDGKEVNKVMGGDYYTKNVVDKIILNEKVVPFFGLDNKDELLNGGFSKKIKAEPDWNLLYNVIAKNYQGDYANRVVSYTKQIWYSIHGDFLSEAKCFNDDMEKYGTDTTDMGEEFKLNQKGYFLFIQNVTDRKELERATSWMEGVVRRGENMTGEWLEAGYWPMYIDTYANLLYKSGRTFDAIKWQELAVSKSHTMNTAEFYVKQMEDNLIKMKRGEPTWRTKTAR